MSSKEDQQNNPTDTLIHNFLHAEQIDNHEKLSMAPSQDYHPLGLFRNKSCEELNLPTLFFGHPRNSKNYDQYSYQQIVQ